MHLSIDAPGKVNLCLLVGPRRTDGYHEVFSVFAPVDLYDELEFSLTLGPPGELSPKPAEWVSQPGASGVGPGRIELDCPGVGGSQGLEGCDNLAIRAISAVEQLVNRQISGSIRIRKMIPVGAGMGGGSSDAAAALRAAARLVEAENGTALEPRDLHRIARGLGADVPFFLQSGPAIAKGIGDLLESVALPSLALVLLLPEEHLATKEVYAAFDRLPAPHGGHSLAERAAAAEAVWRRVEVTPGSAAIAGLLQNDLEAASFNLLPELVDRKRALLEGGALGALMSGSGPTLFGVCSSSEHAAVVAGILGQKGYRTLVVTTAGAGRDSEIVGK